MLAMLERAGKQSGLRPLMDHEAFLRLLERVEEVSPSPTLGLQAAEYIHAGHFGILGYLAMSSTTLADALQYLNRYGRLFHNLHEIRTRTVGADVVLSWTVFPVDYHPLFTELSLATMVAFVRQLVNAPMALSRVQFVHPLQGDKADYERFFGCPVAFGQPQVELQFPLTMLGLPLRQPDATLLNILEQQAAQVLAGLPREDIWLQQVRLHIVRLCREGNPTLEAVADALHLTPRTLQRRLALHELKFQPLLDETRYKLAAQYLSDPNLQLVDVAFLLGFSDQSSMTRAFKRWSGETPHAMRERLSKGS